jgi:hypothetical protein
MIGRNQGVLAKQAVYPTIRMGAYVFGGLGADLTSQLSLTGI